MAEILVSVFSSSKALSKRKYHQHRLPLIQLLISLPFFFFLAMLHGLQDLSSPTMDRTHVPCTAMWILNHWTTREVPPSHSLKNIYLFTWLHGVLALAHRLSSCGTWIWLPQGMWDLSSPTKDRTHVPSIEGQILNRWIAREVPPSHFNARSLSQGNDAQELVA